MSREARERAERVAARVATEAPDLNYLLMTTDAQVWAREFVAIVRERPWIATDEGTMIGWFANAMAARDYRGGES